MKPIFNSLGSNYSFRFALLAVAQIFVLGQKKEQVRVALAERLGKRFSGSAHVFYKGRDAIEFALRVIGVSADDAVMTQAFTCHAIEEAIERTAAQPVFVDLASDGLNPNLQTIEKAFQSSTKKPRVLIIQHTLGIPADIATIAQWCKEHDVQLIEDLAQSWGIQPVAEISISSFGRDKIIDTVSGGVAIFRSLPHQQKAAQLYEKVPEVPATLCILRDLSYPVLTWSIRATHQIGVGKMLFWFAKKIRWMTSPITSPTTSMTRLPVAFAALISAQLQGEDTNRAHRKKIADIYEAAFSSTSQATFDAPISTRSNLRFPVLVKNPDVLARQLTSQKIFLTDRWYRRPVDFGSLSRTTAYVAGSCSRAEYVAQHMLNLPTHQGITPQIAQRIITALRAHESDIL